VFHRTKDKNIVLEQRLREIFGLKEGVAGGWTELYSEELNGVLW
jgi:hypothetical protein